MPKVNDLPTFSAEVVALLPALRAFARRFCREQSDQEDLVQETVLKAFANADRFQAGTNLKSWLFTIEYNAFCNIYGRSRRQVIGSNEPAALQVAVKPEQEWAVCAADFAHALSALPHHYRLAVQWVLIEGVSYEDAARRSGCALGTVKSRVNRGRSQLAEQIMWWD
ncbi:sigma-70 family RNA polymerase sigma factor [Pseudorhizobium pelagicum]|uniref:RNA polymerase sigma factor n=1 Tax=Pseudorhizobium pelagicum TaxID=1509405 RepID=A0A922P1N4_9HYPH|nr:sigma-70 family RNA polymerase sigma factor [Pseudorhizobium pelagicum]KEQ04764.1 hypothetical protein GV68_12305 [Pseudorhizobium pelagicum]KEQ07365.1 hypothetical protein GV67_21530 [Pseudorhizobium pelagicum]